MGYIPSFNDVKHRKPKHIIDVIDKTIARLEKEVES